MFSTASGTPRQCRCPGPIRRRSPSAATVPGTALARRGCLPSSPCAAPARCAAGCRRRHVGAHRLGHPAAALCGRGRGRLRHDPFLRAPAAGRWLRCPRRLHQHGAAESLGPGRGNRASGGRRRARRPARDAAVRVGAAVANPDLEQIQPLEAAVRQPGRPTTTNRSGSACGSWAVPGIGAMSTTSGGPSYPLTLVAYGDDEILLRLRLDRERSPTQRCSGCSVMSGCCWAVSRTSSSAMSTTAVAQRGRAGRTDRAVDPGPAVPARPAAASLVRAGCDGRRTRRRSPDRTPRAGVSS